MQVGIICSTDTSPTSWILLAYRGLHTGQDVRLFGSRITFNMSRITQKLESLGITLPEAPKPVASYIPAKLVGNLLFISGQVPFQDGELICTGSVPSACSPEKAAKAARICAINALAAAHQALEGDLDRVHGVVRLGVFVASEPEFTGQPAVANGASELMTELFGEAGQHVRAAVGSIALPLGASVEVEMILQLKS